MDKILTRKEKASKSMLGKNKEEKNGMWKGDAVGYFAIHDWIKKRIIKPKKCSICGKIGWLDLANISGNYKRELTDWEWICRKCHMVKDGRINNLTDHNNKIRLNKKICIVCGTEYSPKRESSKFCSFNCYTKYRNK